MQLDSLVSSGEALLYMERYVDEGARTYSRFAARSEAAPRYRPRSSWPSFRLVTVRVPRERVTCARARPDHALLARYVRADEVLFPVHPETWASRDVACLDELRSFPLGEPIEVAPTSSTRTVLVLDADGAPPHFLKLHYPRRISRFNRRLRRKSIEASVAVTRELEEIGIDRFGYLAESLGVVFGEGAEGWGFLVREARPRPFRGDTILVPFFSLYAGDLEHPDDPPLLVQIVDRLGADAAEFIVDEVMGPLVEGWAAIARGRGLLLESHAQNVLLELDRDLRPTRIIHRDFDVWIDADTRQRQGLEPLGGSRIGIDTRYPREAHYSLVYDHFIGRELFEYLLAPLVRFFGVDAARVRASVAAKLHRAFPEASALFPAATTFYFTPELLPDNDFALECTGERPLWR